MHVRRAAGERRPPEAGEVRREHAGVGREGRPHRQPVGVRAAEAMDEDHRRPGAAEVGDVDRAVEVERSGQHGGLLYATRSGRRSAKP